MASTTKHALLRLLLLLPLLHTSLPAIAAAPSGSAAAGNAEVDALMELKAALDPSGRSLPSWARGGDPCGRGDYFEGVSCDARGRVATVSLQGKGLAGAISPAVAMLPGLTGLYLHYNALSGAIPRQLGDLPLLAELYLGVNNLSGAIPVELGRLSSLQVLQLGYNQLSGSIPTQLGQLKKLTVLALQSNQLAGAIPASLGDLPELARLDLSSNHLFGSIPSKLAAIPKLVALDLRNNTLSGSVPSGLKKLNEGFHYDNNSELCGARFDSLKPCANGDGDDNEDGGKMPRKPESTSVNVKPLQPPQTMNVNRDCDNGGCSTSSSSSSSTATTLSSGAILAGTIVIVGGVAACGLSVFSWRRRQKQKVGSTVESLEGRGSMDKQKEACQRSNASSSLINVEYSSGWDTSSEGSQQGVRLSPEWSPSVRFNLEEVECATQYFSDVNLLGRSGFAATYRGTMRDGTAVAVKSINKSSCKAEEADFLRGLRVITSLRHDNLVGLRGFCRSRARGECFLVYEFMANGCLSRYLDVKDGEAAAAAVLDWPTRVSIIKGVAKGIEYLHSSKANKAALVHQNISADKILMDHHFTPHLSGAGEHKLVADDVVFSTLKDSAAMGYLAPEYTTTGRFTDRSDVYAFGVVVFQVLTGRKAVSSQLRLLGGAEYSGKLDDLVDPRLAGRFSRPEAAKLAGVALLCTSESPAQRPDMAAVLQQLGATQ
ncbi:somatic embryogenesis receptor kinase 1-like [Oryza brachyantha]|uniref:somatic embryogenesis receptor kinase 1-like n=1 Tax=Oryza brachyantha TaxID=4533 RepID=UPI001ADD51C1|nr:somatic embryogenesis receptor kinase 1-like [Oryza brachyantha]